MVAIDASGMAADGLVVFGAAYLAMNTGAFALVMKAGKTIDDFNGFGKQQPLAAIAMTIFLLSLVGIPPLAGFAGKFLLFGAVLDVGFTWLAVVAIINSVISLAVYLRIIVPVFFKNADEKTSYLKSKPVAAVWLVCLVVTLILGIFINVVL